MKAWTKMQQIESKIADLQSQHDHLLKERNAEIAALIAKVGLHTWDNGILVGGLLHLRRLVQTHPDQREAWHDAGLKFLRAHP